MAKIRYRFHSLEFGDADIHLRTLRDNQQYDDPAGLAEELLRRLGVRDAFASMVGADTMDVRKPDPEHLFKAARSAGGDPALTCLIGDTETDRKTADSSQSVCC